MVNEWVIAALRGNAPDWVVTLITSLIGAAAILVFVIFCNLAAIWIERKLIGRFQIRSGPNRVGPEGLFQPVADVLKIMAKEAIVPFGADKVVFNAAPIFIIVPALLTFAVIPFAPGAALLDSDIGVLFLIAVGSVGVVPTFMAGWSSNNKFSLIGAMRAVAQTISYEIPLVLSLIGLLMMAGTMNLGKLVEYQIAGGWFALLEPLAFIIFFIAGTAELNRTPTDIVEGESEIVAGYHTEYSGFKFSLFYATEYTHVFGMSAIVTTLFLGGWGTAPVLDMVPAVVWFVAKVYLCFCGFVWLRATLPRLRIDQLMGLAWKFLLPLTLINIFFTAFQVFWGLPNILVFAVNAVLAALLIKLWSDVVAVRPAPERRSYYPAAPAA
jgi:NADH-quinone oxidoreductase subunit H